jgi:hypothetical protein
MDKHLNDYAKMVFIPTLRKFSTLISSILGKPYEIKMWCYLETHWVTFLELDGNPLGTHWGQQKKPLPHE